jgi:hypothetical protein
MKIIKKRRSLIASGSKKITKKSNSSRDHILKEQAIRLFVDRRMNKTQIAKYLGTTVAKLNKFLEDPKFVEKIEKRIEMILGIDKDYRIENSKITLYGMYEELQKRIALEELGDVDTAQLHKMIVNTQKELRLDTPGGFTSKIGVGNLDDLQERFNKSLSGKMSRMKKTVKSKEIPEEEIDEEADEYEYGGGT